MLPSGMAWCRTAKQAPHINVESSRIMIGGTPKVLGKPDSECLYCGLPDVEKSIAAVNVVCAIDLINAEVSWAVERRNLREGVRAAPVNVDDEFLGFQLV